MLARTAQSKNRQPPPPPAPTEAPDIADSPPNDTIGPIVSDQTLADALNGDRDAFRQIVRRHQGDVYAVLTMMLMDPATTEQLTQDVLVEAWQARSEAQDEASFKSLLRRLAREKVRHTLAETGERTKRLREFREHLAQQFETDAKASTFARKINEAFRRCTEKLPEHVEKILRLRYAHGQNAQQISKQVGRPVATVRQSLTRALVTIACCMSGRPAAMTRGEQVTVHLLEGAAGQSEVDELEWLLATDSEELERHLALLELEGLLRAMRKDLDVVESTMQKVDQAQAQREQEEQAIRSASQPSAAGVAQRRKRSRRKRAPIGLYVLLGVVVLVVAGLAVALMMRRAEQARQQKTPPNQARLERLLPDAGPPGGQVPAWFPPDEQRAASPLAEMTSESVLDPYIMRDGKSFKPAIRSVFRPGNVLHAGTHTGLVVGYDQNTQLTVLPYTVVEFLEAAGGHIGARLIDLKIGQLQVRTDDDPARPLRIYTDQAIIRPGASRFTVTADMGQTEVEVQTGNVVVARREGDESEQVDSGQRIVVAPAVPLVARAGEMVERVDTGLVALYPFFEGEGDRVHDLTSGGLDLVIDEPSAVEWGDGALTVARPTVIRSDAATTTLNERLVEANAVTLEAWVSPATLEQAGPAPIVAIAEDANWLNVLLGQGESRDLDGAEGDEPISAGAEAGDVFVGRVRTSNAATNPRGLAIRTPDKAVQTKMTHVVFTRNYDGVARIYVDGEAVVEDRMPGLFQKQWGPGIPLVLANGLRGRTPWLGTYRLVAIYDRALSEAQVRQNFEAGALYEPLIPTPVQQRMAAAEQEKVETGEAPPPRPLEFQVHHSRAGVGNDMLLFDIEADPWRISWRVTNIAAADGEGVSISLIPVADPDAVQVLVDDQAMYQMSGRTQPNLPPGSYRVQVDGPRQAEWRIEILTPKPDADAGEPEAEDNADGDAANGGDAQP